MTLQCGDIVSLQETHPYIICHGTWDNKGTRTYVLVNLRNGFRWSDKEFTLPINKEALENLYGVPVKYEGNLK